MRLSRLFAVDSQGLVIRGTQNRMRVSGFDYIDSSGEFVAVTNRGSRVLSSLSELLALSVRITGKWKGGAK